MKYLLHPYIFNNIVFSENSEIKEKFDLKKDKLEELKKQVNLNYNKIFSFYDAIKIRKTLPEIEKYQNANPLKIDSLENNIKKQNQLLVELKNLK